MIISGTSLKKIFKYEKIRELHKDPSTNLDLSLDRQKNEIKYQLPFAAIFLLIYEKLFQN